MSAVELKATAAHYAIVTEIVISEILLSFVLVVNANRRVVSSLAKKKA